jgi:hypothetical protein
VAQGGEIALRHLSPLPFFGDGIVVADAVKRRSNQQDVFLCWLRQI